MTAHAFPDVIDQLVGLQAGGPIDAIRSRRPLARLHAQQSYQALFEPAAAAPGQGSAFRAVERFAVATFVAALHKQPAFVAFYATGLARAGAPAAVQETVIAAAAQGAATGPYGSYPAGTLSAEDVAGPDYLVSPEHRAVLGVRLSAALAHAHLLVLHPRDAKADALRALLDADWSPDDIVTLSQLVAFLSFQVRVVVGLHALAQAPEAAEAH
ncbi:CMD domain protein [Variovorax sp. OV329]|uniref:CMD domain protein n=1 Tax=Variovorax sp. OV329 TaxID=1882825 RepID=UPI0008F12449|nr:CMD domain protein [Variovorax sp. OV329]SFM58993.1 CMD domain protein, Avi_7170 family [Variovorax sp. OV329]